MSDHADGLDLNEVKRDLEAYTGNLPFADTDVVDCGVRGRLVMAVPLLVARIEWLVQELTETTDNYFDVLRHNDENCPVVRERDELRERVRVLEESATVERLTRAIADPGSVVAREGRDSSRPESVPRWSARAVLRALQTREKRHDD
jgi:hypothetical protein